MRNFLNDFSKGVQSHFAAVSFLFKHNLGSYFLIPALLNIAFFVLGIYLAFAVSDLIMEQVHHLIPEEVNKEHSWLGNVIFWGLFILIRIFIFMAFSFAGGHLVVLLMAPVLMVLTRKVMRAKGINTRAYPKVNVFKSWRRSVVVAIKNLLLQILFTVLLFTAGFIPFAALVTPVLLLLVSGYLFGYGFADLYAERLGLNKRESSRFLNRRPGVLLGTGTPYALLLSIPVLGQFTAGFAAVTAATGVVLIMERKKE